MKNIYIFNVSPFTTGIGRYAMALAQLPHTKLVDLEDVLFNHKKYEDKIIHYTSSLVPPKPSHRNIVTIHDLFPLIYPYFATRVFKENMKIYKKFNHIITPSNHVKQQLLNIGFKEKKITTIYECVDPHFHPLNIDKNKLREKLHLPLDKKLILSNATGGVSKNLDLTEKVVRKLGEDFELVHIGDKVMYGINYNNIDDELLNKIYNACDLYLSTSLDEGFGLPPLEAMATKLPIVISNISIFRELYDGIAFAELNVDTMEETVHIVLDNAEYYRAQGLKNAEKYSFENFKNKMKNYYTGVCEQ